MTNLNLSTLKDILLAFGLVAAVVILAIIGLDWSSAVNAADMQNATGISYAQLCAQGDGGCDLAASIARWHR